MSENQNSNSEYEKQSNTSSSLKTALFILFGAIMSIGGYYVINNLTNSPPPPPPPTSLEQVIFHFGPGLYNHAILQKVQATPEDQQIPSSYPRDILENDFKRYMMADNLQNGKAWIQSDKGELTEIEADSEGWTYCDCNGGGGGDEGGQGDNGGESNLNVQFSLTILETEDNRCHYGNSEAAFRTIHERGTTASFAYLEGQNLDINPAEFKYTILKINKEYYTLIDITWKKNRLESGYGIISFKTGGEEGKQYDLYVYIDNDPSVMKFFY